MEIHLVFHLVCFGLLLIANSESRYVFPNIPDEYATLDYVSHKVNTAGEVELRLSYQGILVIETLTPNFGEGGLFFRHSSDAKHVVKAIRNGEDLVDCDIERSKVDREEFTASFMKGLNFFDTGLNEYITKMLSTTDNSKPYKSGNHTFTLVHSKDQLTPEQQHMLDFETQKSACRRLHKAVLRSTERKLNKKNSRHGRDHISRGDLRQLVGWVGAEESIAIPEEKREIFTRALIDSKSKGPKIEAEDLLQTDDIDGLGEILREKQEKARQEEEKERKKNPQRKKRSTLIYPGTKWCGKGSSATHYDDLGENNGTDACCRAHDHCPFYVEGFATNYGIFNYRMHTLSRCECDVLFRNCLKDVGDPVAEMIGTIYFNYMGTKCFKLSKEKTCSDRSWWGFCRKNHAELKGEVMPALKF